MEETDWFHIFWFLVILLLVILTLNITYQIQETNRAFIKAGYVQCQTINGNSFNGLRWALSCESAVRP